MPGRAERRGPRDVPGGAVLHVASGAETTTAELAGLCRSAAGAPGHPVEHQRARPGEAGRNLASYGLASQVLGCAPGTGREDGIRRTWQWFQESVSGS
jgi:nucleoside-diphosphate-sugar epimerase